jgi:hypothetical protein
MKEEKLWSEKASASVVHNGMSKIDFRLLISPLALAFLLVLLGHVRC